MEHWNGGLSGFETSPTPLWNGAHTLTDAP